MRGIWKLLTLTAALLAPVSAHAASRALVTSDLNIRTGPGVEYQRYAVIPDGETVSVYGCLRGYGWCDVSWDGERGWVNGDYLLDLGHGRRHRSVAAVGVPIFGFDPYDYHRRHYTGRTWYHDRYLGARQRPAYRVGRRDDDGPGRGGFERRGGWREDRIEDEDGFEPGPRRGGFGRGGFERGGDDDRDSDIDTFDSNLDDF